jgi:hypothetical protein
VCDFATRSLFYDDKLVAQHPTPKQEDHSLLDVFDSLVCIHQENRNKVHVHNHKQYSIHTLILDTVLEIAEETDPFMGEDADELSESVPLFDISCIM